jgi:hypothetical protein
MKNHILGYTDFSPFFDGPFSSEAVGKNISFLSYSENISLSCKPFNPQDIKIDPTFSAAEIYERFCFLRRFNIRLPTKEEVVYWQETSLHKSTGPKPAIFLTYSFLKTPENVLYLQVYRPSWGTSLWRRFPHTCIMILVHDTKIEETPPQTEIYPIYH